MLRSLDLKKKKTPEVIQGVSEREKVTRRIWLTANQTIRAEGDGKVEIFDDDVSLSLS